MGMKMDCKRAKRFLQHRIVQPSAIPDLPPQYAKMYNVLLTPADKLEDHARTENLLMLGCAVYAWMPTILRTWEFSEFASGALSIQKFRSCDDLDDAASLVSGRVSNPLLNNSWIGTSKLLHFVNPAVFPIWDSKVAARFGLKPHRTNSKSFYLDYLGFCWDVQCSDPEHARAFSPAHSPHISSISARIKLVAPAPCGIACRMITCATVSETRRYAQGHPCDRPAHRGRRCGSSGAQARRSDPPMPRISPQIPAPQSAPH